MKLVNAAIVGSLVLSTLAAKFRLPLYQERRAVTSSSNDKQKRGQKTLEIQENAHLQIGHHRVGSGSPIRGVSDTEDFYIINITIGTPPQNFRAVIDINWAEPFIPSVSCRGEACQNYLLYNSSASSTYTQNGTKTDIEYYPIKADGWISSDSFALGGEGSKFEKMDFVELKDYDDWFADVSLEFFDTVLGFAMEREWPTVDYGRAKRIHSPFRQMYDAGVLDSNVFSILWPQNHSDIGSIIIGGYDDNLVEGPLIRHRLLPRLEDNWAVGVQAVYIQSHTHSEVFELKAKRPPTLWTSQLSNTAQYIGLPAGMGDEFFTHIKRKRSHCTDMFVVDCSELSDLPTLIFNFGNQNISVMGADYVEKFLIKPDWNLPWLCDYPPEEAEEECVVVVGTFPDFLPPAEMALGVPFLRKVYSVFDADFKTISFSQLKDK